MKRPSILVVDDEPDNFDVIETLLSVGAAQNTSPANAIAQVDQNYQLHYAANGEEAIQQLDTFNPDLILLDVMMPGMDGVEVCRHIKAMSQWRAVPIIIVTALSSKTDLAQCLAAGADDFISKPVNAAELRARVQSMLRIKQQYDDLQALLKLREDMARMIVHDLRNPLSNILLGLDLLKREENLNAKQDLILTQINVAAKTLQTSINDLLKVAVLESGKVRLNRTEIDLCDLIQSILLDFEEITTQKQQILISQFSQDSQSICVDVALFRRVLDNLISNAIKFSPSSSPIIVSTELLLSGDSKIQVIDYGPGVPETLQQKIFEKYEIGVPIPNTPQTGLGLAFCKMVVEAHGGTIFVKKNQPKGAVFEIILPA